jgi:hypothetical protein
VTAEVAPAIEKPTEAPVEAPRESKPAKAAAE